MKANITTTFSTIGFLIQIGFIKICVPDYANLNTHYSKIKSNHAPKFDVCVIVFNNAIPGLSETLA